MKKKMVSALLAGAMLASLMAGCGNDSGSGDGSTEKQTGADTEQGSDEQKDSAGGESDAGGEEDGYSAQIDMEEEPYEVAVQLVVLPGTDYSAFEGQIEEAIDAITLPNINCTVDVQYVWINEVADKTSLAIVGDEKIDVVSVMALNPLSSLASQDMLMDMNEGNLLKNRGPVLTEVLGQELVDAGVVNGQQMAVPAQMYSALRKGIYYNKTATDAAGVTIPESGSWEDLDGILHDFAVAAGTDTMGWYLGQGTSTYLYWLVGYERFGTLGQEGVILDPFTDTTIENLYATDLFKDYALKMYQWRKDGILQKDTTDSTSGQDYFNSGKLLALPADLSPETEATYTNLGAANNIEIGYMYFTDPLLTTNAVDEYMWGIASNCERPDKAMDFLNLLYSNTELANILKYGLEGTNYDFAEGSDTIINTNGTYNTAFYRGGDTREMYVVAPADETYISTWEEFEGKAKVSPVLGYIFLDADYQTEVSVIANVINEYMPTLQSGLCASEEATLEYLDEFNAALEAAGMSDVIAANQAQLDAWLAAQ